MVEPPGISGAALNRGLFPAEQFQLLQAEAWLSLTLKCSAVGEDPYKPRVTFKGLGRKFCLFS